MLRTIIIIMARKKRIISLKLFFYLLINQANTLEFFNGLLLNALSVELLDKDDSKCFGVVKKI